MSLHSRAVFRSTVFTLVAGLILWPPVSELLYWSVFDGIGDAVILPVLVVSVAVGAGFSAFTSTTPRSFAVGGTLAYFIGMGGIEVVLTPVSPVHFLSYGVILIGMGSGVVVAAVVESETGASTTGENSPES